MPLEPHAYKKAPASAVNETTAVESSRGVVGDEPRAPHISPRSMSKLNPLLFPDLLRPEKASPSARGLHPAMFKRSPKARRMSAPARAHRSLSPPRSSRRLQLGIEVLSAGPDASPSKGDSSPSSPSQLPQFTDNVKRSTRFSTTVPAVEVMQRIYDLIEDNPYPLAEARPFMKVRQTADVDWDNYTVTVQRNDVVVCTVRIFLLSAGLYMVEFVRGQVDIFEFKQFYEELRSVYPKSSRTTTRLRSSNGRGFDSEEPFLWRKTFDFWLIKKFFLACVGATIYVKNMYIRIVHRARMWLLHIY